MNDSGREGIRSMTATNRRGRTWLLVLLIGHLLLAGAYSLWVPLGEAPDEADHWAYIQYLAREHRLPQGPELTQAKHPPLYHASAAVLASLVVPNLGGLDSRLFLRANPDVSFWSEDIATGGYSYNSFIHTTYEEWPWRPGPLAFHLARFWSVLLSTLTVWATYRLLLTIFPGEDAFPLVLATTAFVAFLPEFAFIGSVLNNDTLAALLGTAALWGGWTLYRSRGQMGGVDTGLALGLGVWAKVSTIALWPTVFLLALLGAWRARPHPRRWGRGVVLPFMAATLIAAPWFIRNWRLYGDPTGIALARQTVDQRTTPWTWADTRWLLNGWFHSFWGKFGSAGHIPMNPFLYQVLLVLTLLAVMGLFLALLRRQAFLPVAIFTLAAGSVALAIWRYSLIALGTDQGRLLFPALAPLAGLLVLGWMSLVPARQRGLLALLIGMGMAGLGVYGLVGVIRSAYAPPPTASALEWGRLPRMVPLRFEDVALVAWEAKGGNITLYWLAMQRPRVDQRAVLRLSDDAGRVVWEWKRSPGAGRWSTDHWPRGYVMRDVYPAKRLASLPAGRYRLQVGMYPFMGKMMTPVQGETQVDSPFVTLGWVRR